MNRFNLVSVLFVFLILIGGVFAAGTLSIPSDVNKGEPFLMDITCDSFSGITPGDGCEVVCRNGDDPFNGQEIFSGIVDDDTPGPESLMATLLVEGDHTCYLYEVEDLFSNRRTLLDDQNITVHPDEDFDDYANTYGTIWLRYRQAGPNVTVSGLTPIGTEKVVIAMYDENNASLIPGYWEAVGTDDSKPWDYFDSNAGEYNHQINLGSYNPQVLNIRAIFRDENNNEIVENAEAVLEAYLLYDLVSQVEEIENNVFDLNQSIYLIEGDVNDLQEDVNDLFTEVNNLYVALNDLNLQLASEVANLQSQIDSIDSNISNIYDLLVEMNHGTLQIRYRQDIDALDVQGEAPIGATDAEYRIYNANDKDTVILTGSTFIDTNSRYYFNEFNGNEVDISTLPPAIYNFEVIFGGLPGNYKVIQPFGELLTLDLNDRLTDIEEQVEEIWEDIDVLNAGSINLEYNNYWKTLDVRGDVPLDTTRVDVYMWDASWNTVKYQSTTLIDETSVGRAYEFEIDVNNLPITNYNVFVLYYTGDTNFVAPLYPLPLWNANLIGTSSALFGGLLEENIIGFSGITTNTYVPTYYVNDINVPVAFNFKVPRSGMYKFDYNINGTVRELVSCTWMTSAKRNSVKGEISLDDSTVDQVNEVTIIATNCYNSNDTYESYLFEIKHVDLSSLLTAETTIVSPLVNSDTNLPYPYGSAAAEVFWTQSGSVPLIAYINTTSVPQSLYSKVRFKGASANPASKELTIKYNGTNWDINGIFDNFNTSWNYWNNINHTNGIYTIVELESLIVSSTASYADINIGIDNESPSINSIDPNPEKIMSGVYRWFSDINDNLSGLDQVNFYLIEKQDVNYCDANFNCHLGNGAIVWSETRSTGVDFNTSINQWYVDLNTLNHPDGDYNVAFEATDIAGNYAYLEVDPIIDNSEPIIDSIIVTPNPILRGNEVIVKVDTYDYNLTGKATGIDKVIATITDANNVDINSLVLTKDGNYYTTSFLTDVNWDVNTYTITIDVNDFAGNSESDDVNVNVFQNYSLGLPSAVSGTVTFSNTINGTIVSDDVNAYGIPTDNNIIYIDSQFADTNMVEFDLNGNFSFNLSVTSAGTHTVTVWYASTDANYIEEITINASNPSTGGSGGGGGASGGAPRTTTPTDANEPIIEEPVEENNTDVDAGNDDIGLVVTDANEPVTIEEEQPEGPTGFFGLGGAENILLPIILVLILAGLIFFAYKRINQ